MKHPDRLLCRHIDSPDRCAHYTDIVYNAAGDCEGLSAAELHAHMKADIASFEPQPNPFHIYFGDLHGHTNFSDGSVDADTYFCNLRDLAKVDFCALSDHDHGGVGHPTLWEKNESGVCKWDLILAKTDEYYIPGKFTTIPAYERDSYPWFLNMVLYYRSTKNAEMFRGVRDGEITGEELDRLTAKEDILFGPHTCSQLSCGSDLRGRQQSRMPKTFEIFSTGGAYEEYDGPFPAGTCVRGCSYRDALNAGAHPACIACSDNHSGYGGRDMDPAKKLYTGMTGVWAEENTREAIFDALRARRCYGFIGAGRVTVDFRLNGHFMGEEIRDEDEKRVLYYKVESETPVARIDIVKNGQSVFFARNSSDGTLFDWDAGERAETANDWYYLRVTLADGRLAWTSAIRVLQ